MLNHYDLGLYVGWFEISRDFIGLPELYGLKYENLITPVIIFLYLCSYNLDGSVTVLANDASKEATMSLDAAIVNRKTDIRFFNQDKPRRWRIS
jgi:hypothetical protein